MKKQIVWMLAACALVLGLASSRAEATMILPLDGSWTTLDEGMLAGEYFDGIDGSGHWKFSSTDFVLFTITDFLVVSDRFKVYDNDVLVFTTPEMKDWPAYSSNRFGPPWTDDPDVALASGVFSSMVWLFAPGDHSISIQDIHIPPLLATAGSAPFPDGTVAFKAEAVPEPGVLSLLGLGLVGVWAARRRSA